MVLDCNFLELKRWEISIQPSEIFFLFANFAQFEYPTVLSSYIALNVTVKWRVVKLALAALLKVYRLDPVLFQSALFLCNVCGHSFDGVWYFAGEYEFSSQDNCLNVCDFVTSLSRTGKYISIL